MFRPLPLCLLILSAAACTSSGEPDYKDNPDDIPSAERASVEGQTRGEASTASKVESYRVDVDGTLVKQFEGAVEADGSFSVDIQAMSNGGDETDTNDFAIVKALDADGKAVGWVLVEETGAAGSSVNTTPIDAESTVEAMTWLKIVQKQGDKSACNHADLRGRIDADIAVDVYANTPSYEESSDELDSLTASIEAAAATEIEALAELGHTTTIEAMYAAEKSASLALTATLYAAAEGSNATGEAEGAESTFYAEATAAIESEYDLTAEDTSRMNATSWLAQTTTIESTLGASQMWDSAVLVYGEAQAWASARATEEAMTSEDFANASVVAQVEAALDSFVEECDAAENDDDVEAMGEAWGEFEAILIGTASEESLTETLLSLDFTGALAYQTAAEASLVSADTLFAEVSSHAQGYASSGDAQAMAQATIDAWTTYESDIDGISAELMSQLQGQISLNDGERFFSTVFVESAGTFTVLE